jgi:hypothetical protein
MDWRKRSRFVCVIWAIVVVGLTCVSQSYAQSTTEGAIGGTVTDQSNAILPGVSVTVRNIATNGSAEAVTDGVGRFVVIRLQPGVYSVTASLDGFSSFKQENVVVEVGRITSIDVSLGIAGQAETVVVTGQSPIINTEQSDFSTNIDQTAINNLPTNTRRWSTFALMTPGAAPDGNFGLVSFRGISGLLNNNTVDGGDNTQAFFSEERGRTRLAYSVSADAVRDFQVTTSNYSAEYGRAAGGVVNAVTKSGSNQFHGSGFYFIRDNKWGATNPFQTQTALVDGAFTQVPFKPQDRRQQFGATLGGPIVTNKLFFFFSYDEQDRDFPGIAAPSNASGFFAPFSEAEQTTFAQRGITPAQQADGLSFLQGLTGVVPRDGDQRIFLPKVDWMISPNHTFAASYNNLRWDSPLGCRRRAWFPWDRVGATMASTATGQRLGDLDFRFADDQRNPFPVGGVISSSGESTPDSRRTRAANGRTPQTTILGVGGLVFGKPDFLERRSPRRASDADCRHVHDDQGPALNQVRRRDQSCVRRSR